METSETIVDLLRDLGEAVSDHVVQHRDPNKDYREDGFQGGDTIFSIDRLVEPVIVDALLAWPDEFKPLTVVGEGMGNSGCFRVGERREEPKLRLMIDPIDGTSRLLKNCIGER